MAFDRARARSVLFGGLTGLGDTWEYYCSCQNAGPGKVGGGAAIACQSAPAIGNVFTITFPTTLGINWIALGAGGCAKTPTPLGPPALCSQG